MPPRLTARIVPPQPITVAIVGADGAPLAYGVIADVSESGACVWTDAHLRVNATLDFRISFARPPDLYEVSGLVVWAQDCLPGSGRGARRYGIEWLGATPACRHRLRDLAARAVPSREVGRYPFEARWIVESP